MDDIRKQLEGVQETLDVVSDIQLEQKYILAEHMRRTAANESRLHVMESFRDTFESHMDKILGAMTAFKYMGGIATFSVVVFQLINLIKGM